MPLKQPQRETQIGQRFRTFNKTSSQKNRLIFLRRWSFCPIFHKNQASSQKKTPILLRRWCLSPSHFVTAPGGISSLLGTGQKFFEPFGLSTSRSVPCRRRMRGRSSHQGCLRKGCRGLCLIPGHLLRDRRCSRRLCIHTYP